MERKVVITGIGLVTPGGTLSTIWETLLKRRSAAQTITSFDTSAYPNGKAGIIDQQDLFTPFAPRLLKRMDRFSALAMAATHQALQDSRINMDVVDPMLMGISIGNMYGGWEITDPGLRSLLVSNYREVSPYIASAWFPTAAQGQISIHWGLKGFSKTIVADTASSALSIGYAAQAIREGRADIMLAGGAEAPITPYVYSFCTRSNRLSTTDYQVFNTESTGFLIGEGAVILVLEEMEAARRRNAHIYAEISGWATGYLPHTNTPWNDGGKRLASIIHQACTAASITPNEIDYVGLDAQGIRQADTSEVQALELAFRTSHQPGMTTCKPTLTHLLGAAAAIELVTALLAMQHNIIPPISSTSDQYTTHSLHLITDQEESVNIQHALINARGSDGVQSAIVIKKL